MKSLLLAVFVSSMAIAANGQMFTNGPLSGCDIQVATATLLNGHTHEYHTSDFQPVPAGHQIDLSQAPQHHINCYPEQDVSELILIRYSSGQTFFIDATINPYTVVLDACQQGGPTKYYTRDGEFHFN